MLAPALVFPTAAASRDCLLWQRRLRPDRGDDSTRDEVCLEPHWLGGRSRVELRVRAFQAGLPGTGHGRQSHLP
eukprot:346594-Lingulodinium_polyedra.AAC.1